MLDILDVLYNYIQENRIAYYLNGDPEYCLAGRRMEAGRLWQRGYYDHIVRSENDFLRIWTYIDNNPLRWELDRYYTER